MSDNRSYWISSGTYTFLTRIATMVFGLGAFWCLARMLPKLEFGAFSQFMIITSLIEVARNGLIQNAQIKFCASATNEEYPLILKASLTLNIILSAISLLILFFIAPILAERFHYPILTDMFRIYCISIILLIPFSQFNNIQQARLDFRGIFYSTLFRQGLFSVVVMIYFALNYQINILELVWWQVGAAGVASFISYLFVKKHWVTSKGIDWKWVVKLFQYGKYVFGTNLSAMIYQSIDQWLLGSKLGLSAAGSFNVAMRITNLVDVPISTVVSVVFPKSSRISGENQQAEIKSLFERSTGFMLAMILPACLITISFPEVIIMIIGGDKYVEESSSILQITIFSIVLQPFLRQFGTMLDSVGKPNINFFTILFIAVLNYTLNNLFIDLYGIKGAAYGTLASLTVFVIIARIILGRLFKIEFLNCFKYIPQFYKELWLMLTRKIIKQKA